MATLRLLFSRNTAIGSAVALSGEVHTVDFAVGRELLALNRAVLAPDEPELPPPGPLTTEIFGMKDPSYKPEATVKPKKGAKS